MHSRNSLGTSASPKHASVTFSGALDSTQLQRLGVVHRLTLHSRQIFLFNQWLYLPIVSVPLNDMTRAVYLSRLWSHLLLLGLAGIHLRRLHRLYLGTEYAVPRIAKLLRNQVTWLLVQVLSNVGAADIL